MEFNKIRYYDAKKCKITTKESNIKVELMYMCCLNIFMILANSR